MTFSDEELDAEARALVRGASDRDFPAELHQVDVDGSAAMTKSNRRDDVAVRFDSYCRSIVCAIAADFTNINFDFKAH